MKREIKFKAWDTNDKKILLWEQLLQVANNVGGGGNWIFNNGRLSLIQFTGLKDKNGKEIYEGDILKGTFPIRKYKNFDNGIVIWAKVRCAFVIEVITGEIKHYNELTSCDADGTVNVETMIDYYMEVIGNIYENPELLETKKDQLSERKVE